MSEMVKQYQQAAKKVPVCHRGWWQPATSTIENNDKLVISHNRIYPLTDQSLWLLMPIESCMSINDSYQVNNNISCEHTVCTNSRWIDYMDEMKYLFIEG
jgi:hypothetical protein